MLEVGTGTGSLTGLIAAKANHVVTVEIDQHLHQLAQEELEEFENITFLHQDALKNKNNYHPTVFETIQNRMDATEGTVFKLAANLPYNIATPVISNLLRCPITPEIMSVTIQKELGDRIVAEPNSKDYGALSLWIQSLCDAEIVRVMKPSVFWPSPKVDSAIVRMVFRPDKRAQIEDLEFFHRFSRAIFFHRRKFLRSVAISAFKTELNKPQVDDVLQKMGLGPQARTEQLSVAELQALCELFRQKVLEVNA